MPARAAPTLDFHTQVLERGSHGRRAPAFRSGFDAAVLRSSLVEGDHFILPLRKRPDGEVISESRISVGRARNTDVILRHASVSKFHCWFELGEDAQCSIADAGSKNRTFVNGSALALRELVPLKSGDRIRFGSVEGILSAAEIFREAVHLVQASPTQKYKVG